jgi:hypothetical protein
LSAARAAPGRFPAAVLVSAQLHLARVFHNARTKSAARCDRRASEARRIDAMTMSAKMVLISILFLSIIIPARAAQTKDPKKGLKKALIQMAIFNLIYVLALTFLYPRLL